VEEPRDDEKANPGEPAGEELLLEDDSESAAGDAEAPLPDEGAGVPADDTAADPDTAPADKGDEEKAGGFLTNKVLRIVAVAATVIGLILAMIGVWNLLYTEPVVPEGLSSAPSDGVDTDEDWDAVGAPASDETFDLSAGVGAMVEPPSLGLDLGDSLRAEADAPDTMLEPDPIYEPPAPVVAPAPAPQPVTRAPTTPSVARPPLKGPSVVHADTKIPDRYLESPAASGKATTPRPRSAAHAETVPPLVSEPSAYDQLMMSRGMGDQSSAPDVDVVEEDGATAAVFHDAGWEFVRLLVEDAAGLLNRIPADDWARLVGSSTYERVIYTIYDHVFTTSDKLRLYSAYSREGVELTIAPPELAGMSVPTLGLDAVRDAIWSERGGDIERLIAAVP